jgi:hypothetical protein
VTAREAPAGPPRAWRHLPFLLLALGAVAAAAVVWLAMPHSKEIGSLWVLLVKLLPFVLATEAVALLELDARARHVIGLLAVPAVFLVFFAFFVPRIFFYADDGPTLYYYVLTLTPFMILGLTLTYRLGGGTAAAARRLSYAMLLLMLSGIEDLAFLTLNPHTDPRWTPIPDRWTWASHITVVLGGHVATRLQAYAFIAVHVVLAGLVLFLPGRVVRAALGGLTRRGLRRGPAPPPPAPELTRR